MSKKGPIEKVCEALDELGKIIESQESKIAQLQSEADYLRDQRNWFLRRVIINRHGEVALGDASTTFESGENLQRLNKAVNHQRGGQ